MHIQNSKRDFEPDDINAFSAARMTLAEKVLEKTAKVLSAKYPRPGNAMGFVVDFEFPWNPHFP